MGLFFFLVEDVKLVNPEMVDCVDIGLVFKFNLRTPSTFSKRSFPVECSRLSCSMDT
ncbi:hypothetical protein LSH36_556g00003 [Paralvinella palmiformis]|uniref:Uncharacterized protein n=1 Tax=Paralvinella palmiformis TaxID=53620 RepID=A0AAD9MXG4_9ANNE|nr:hypothetical protein LSH36_556g00003 [Paralvinella palmiformis]